MQHGAEQAVATQALSPGDLMAAQALVRRLPIGESVVDAILKLVRAGRPEQRQCDERSSAGKQVIAGQHDIPLRKTVKRSLGQA